MSHSPQQDQIARARMLSAFLATLVLMALFLGLGVELALKAADRMPMTSTTIAEAR